MGCELSEGDADRARRLDSKTREIDVHGVIERPKDSLVAKLEHEQTREDFRNACDTDQVAETGGFAAGGIEKISLAVALFPHDVATVCDARDESREFRCDGGEFCVDTREGTREGQRGVGQRDRPWVRRTWTVDGSMH